MRNWLMGFVSAMVLVSTMATLERPSQAQSGEVQGAAARLLGTWAIRGDTLVFGPDGTGTYYRDGEVCYQFSYGIETGPGWGVDSYGLWRIADRENSCGGAASSPIKWKLRFSYRGDIELSLTRDQKQIVTQDWRRQASAQNGSIKSASTSSPADPTDTSVNGNPASPSTSRFFTVSSSSSENIWGGFFYWRFGHASVNSGAASRNQMGTAGSTIGLGFGVTLWDYLALGIAGDLLSLHSYDTEGGAVSVENGGLFAGLRSPRIGFYESRLLACKFGLNAGHIWTSAKHNYGDTYCAGTDCGSQYSDSIPVKGGDYVGGFAAVGLPLWGTGVAGVAIGYGAYFDGDLSRTITLDLGLF